MTPAERQARIERIIPEVVIAFLAELDIDEQGARAYVDMALMEVITDTAMRMAHERPDVDALTDKELIAGICKAFVVAVFHCS